MGAVGTYSPPQPQTPALYNPPREVVTCSAALPDIQIETLGSLSAGTNDINRLVTLQNLYRKVILGTCSTSSSTFDCDIYLHFKPINGVDGSSIATAVEAAMAQNTPVFQLATVNAPRVLAVEFEFCSPLPQQVYLTRASNGSTTLWQVMFSNDFSVRAG